MKREMTAVLLLLALLLASIINLRHFDALTGWIEAALTQSEAAAAKGEFDAALKAYEQAENLWLGAKSYTGIFLRHPEVDSISDAFFDVKELLLEGKSEECAAAFDKLYFHLDCLNSMEHARLGSIF